MHMSWPIFGEICLNVRALLQADESEGRWRTTRIFTQTLTPSNPRDFLHPIIALITMTSPMSSDLDEGNSSSLMLMLIRPHILNHTRVCPGRQVGEANVWAALVSILATLSFSKAKDSLGNEIEIQVGFTESTVR